MAQSVLWPWYGIASATADLLVLRGETFNPSQADPTMGGLNLARARRLTGVAFPGRTVRVSDPTKIAAILEASRSQANFVDQMTTLGATTRAGKRALASIKALQDLLK